jgi:hypothetical protein
VPEFLIAVLAEALSAALMALLVAGVKRVLVAAGG